MPGTPRILFVDAYDSFSRNIIALLYRCVAKIDVLTIHIDTDVREHFGVDLETFVSGFEAVVLGPGPGDPRNDADIGLFEDILSIATAEQIPLLGVCLGFQVLCLRNGYNISRMPMPCHGQSRRIISTNKDIFENISRGPNVTAMCYNSLAVAKSQFAQSQGRSRPSSSDTDRSTDSSISDFALLESDQMGSRVGLILLAWDDDEYAMAVRHPALPFWALQFHPESCMSLDCADIVTNWWRMVDLHNKEKRVFKTQIGHPVGKSILSISRRLHGIGHHKSAKFAKAKVIATGKVSWTATKMRTLTSSHLSRFCYDSTGSNGVAMLESTAKGRYCIYGFTEDNARTKCFAQGKLITRHGQTIIAEQHMPPIEALEDLENETKTSACTGGCPDVPFWGGWIGFLSYEMGLDLIEVESSQKRATPDFSFLFVTRSVVLDQLTGNIYVQSIKPDDTAWVLEMQGKLEALSKAQPIQPPADEVKLRHALAVSKMSIPDHKLYMNLIRTCQEELHAGNSYELCLTSEAVIEFPASDPYLAYLLYQNLNKHNPVPYASYLRLPGPSQRSDLSSPNCSTTIISTSPEQFLSWSRTGVLDMMPMKGTIQRTAGTTLADATKVLGSPKETAENLMIADLICHDLHGVVGCKQYPFSKVATDPYKHSAYLSPSRNDSTLPGAEERGNSNEDTKHSLSPANCTSAEMRDPIQIRALNSIKEFDTVYQLVSHVRALPHPGLSPDDIQAVISHNHSSLRQVLPPGSMTGAPKKRSCEILKQLEGRNRGVYSGIIGYMDVGGGGCWSVAIRTAFSNEAEDYFPDKGVDGEREESDTVEVEKRKIWHVGAGGAVTVLSDVEAEWQEMMGKMNNVLKGFREVREGTREWSRS